MAAPALKTVLSSKEVLIEAAKTKAGMVGFGMLIMLIATVVVVPIYAPFDVVRAWGSFAPWSDNPNLAAPEWVDAFTSQAFRGNPAAVCLLDGERDATWMQNVAAEMNLSEIGRASCRERV